MNLQRPNWYGFKHEEVVKRFEGDLTFVNEFCVKDEYKPVAVYRAANPNREKGHKDFMLLQTQGGGGLVRGMSTEEMEPYRYQAGLHCFHCGEVIYSVMRHDMRSCACKEENKQCFIDGGRDYCKVSFGNEANYEHVIIDLLDSRILRDVTDEKESAGRSVARRRRRSN